MATTVDDAVIHECTKLSMEGKISFPEVVKRLSEVGVERYHADLARLEKTSYIGADRTEQHELPLDAPPPIGESFSEEGVRQALLAVQQSQIDYPEFLRRIMTAGTAGYMVFLQGRKAIYFGRHGDFWVERFPGSR